MKLLYSFLFLSGTTLLLSCCTKDPNVPVDISKITVTDSTCIYVSDIDSTDWTYDNYWSTGELDYFKFKDTSVVVTDTGTGYIQVSAACPNPNQGLFIMGVNTERQCKLKVVCINSEFQVLYYHTRKLTGGPIVTGYDFSSPTAFHKNENYRLYYAFYNSRDSLYYKGHGDFRIE